MGRSSIPAKARNRALWLYSDYRNTKNEAAYQSFNNYLKGLVDALELDYREVLDSLAATYESVQGKIVNIPER